MTRAFRLTNKTGREVQYFRVNIIGMFCITIKKVRNYIDIKVQAR